MYASIFFLTACTASRIYLNLLFCFYCENQNGYCHITAKKISILSKSRYILKVKKFYFDVPFSLHVKIEYSQMYSKKATNHYMHIESFDW